MTPSAQALTPPQRARFLELVDRHFGIRGSDYGASRIDVAVQNVLAIASSNTAAELLDTLDEQSNPRWLYALVEHLTVGETYFLRDAAQTAAFRDIILPDVMARRAADQRLRIWSAGCSTGEEVYTLAILLTEARPGDSWDISLIGTDVNRDSLRVARDAQYPAWSFRTTPDEVRERYFEPVGKNWRLIEPVRRMARFAWMNLGADPLLPPSNDMDVIMCRNVTIYFDDAAAQRLYRALVSSLTPGGWLVLGPSDPVPTDRTGLERLDVSDAVLWRRAQPTRSAITPRTPARTPIPASVNRRRPDLVETPQPAVRDDRNELEAGLLALESGSAAFAMDCLRRATFRDPSNPLAQFALARAYADLGDAQRAHAALVHARRLLAPLASDELVPGSDSLQVETLRQSVDTYLFGRAV
jgi:chemotaxis protein methyltransferase CheR